MSDLLFPTLVSSNWKLTRTPQWITQVQTSVSGVRCSAGFRSSPLWKWTLKNGVLQAADTIQDLQTVESFFNLLAGAYDSFLWQDPEPVSFTGGTVRVAFLQDAVDFDRLCGRIWQTGNLEFQQVRT